MMHGGDLEVARRRGRWAASSALQRYTKCHVLVEKSAEMGFYDALSARTVSGLPL